MNIDLYTRTYHRGHTHMTINLQTIATEHRNENTMNYDETIRVLHRTYIEKPKN